MFRTVRNLALGLRPSMLDDFGLQAALEWHARDCMSRFAIDVDLQTDGDFDALPDKHRTCVYRVVQEATTNCVRHAGAKKIQIRVSAEGDHLWVRVSDDGRGLDPRQRPGLGLRGIDERVKELHGTMTITSAETGGTTVLVGLPLPTRLAASEVDVPLARAAG
jgi:signal transduction histidine kinase